MEIKRQGVEITGVPGTEYIRVQESQLSEGGACVVVKYGIAEHSMGFGITELAEHIEALQVALNEARLMAGMLTAQDGEPVTFSLGMEITERMLPYLPLGTVLRDKEDDFWHVRADGLHFQCEGRSVDEVAYTGTAFNWAPLVIHSLPGTASLPGGAA